MSKNEQLEALRKEVYSKIDAYTLRERQTGAGYGVPLTETTNDILQLFQSVLVAARIDEVNKSLTILSGYWDWSACSDLITDDLNKRIADLESESHETSR